MWFPVYKHTYTVYIHIIYSIGLAKNTKEGLIYNDCWRHPWIRWLKFRSTVHGGNRSEGATLSKWHSKVWISSMWYPFGGASWTTFFTPSEHSSTVRAVGLVGSKSSDVVGLLTKNVDFCLQQISCSINFYYLWSPAANTFHFLTVSFKCAIVCIGRGLVELNGEIFHCPKSLWKVL